MPPLLPPEPNLLQLPKARWYHRKSVWAFIIFTVVIIAVLGCTFFCIAPSKFPSGKIIHIPKGTTLSETAQLLVDNNIIRSKFFYKVAVVLIGGSKSIMTGDYAFDQPQSVLRVAYRTVKGVQDLVQIKVTIPEGTSAKDAAIILSKAIPGFDMTSFVLLSKQYEGYLFPDTYYFYKNTIPENVVEAMRNNFDSRISNIKVGTTSLSSGLLSVASSSRKFSDIITMASIVEKEATNSVDRRIVAGILWKRLDKGMALQVDPPFFYILDKNSSQLTLDDLATDSPYNLYKHTGLTPTPIDNPGIDAILDTINPTATPYWFYLSDKNGNMHYASTFDGHLENKSKFL